MKPEVIHIRDATGAAHEVYIGRPRPGIPEGPFGNPITKGNPCPVCGKVHAAPGSTLPCYRKWLWGKMQEDLLFRQQIKDLWGKTLVCYCAPDPCHGDVLAAACYWLNQHIFHCKECGYRLEIDPFDDPTTSSGACRCCGGGDWTITGRDGNRFG